MILAFLALLGYEITVCEFCSRNLHNYYNIKLANKYLNYETIEPFQTLVSKLLKNNIKVTLALNKCALYSSSTFLLVK